MSQKKIENRPANGFMHSLIQVLKSPFSARIDNWKNMDIKPSEERTDYLEGQFGAVARLFDWQELQDFFNEHEHYAKPSRLASQGKGVLATALGTIGLVIVAFVPLADNHNNHIWLAGGIAAIFSGVGIFMGLLYSVNDGAKQKWLWHRFCTERARQFQFQFLLSNIPDVLEELKHEKPTKQFESLKQRALQDFLSRYMSCEGSEYEKVLADEAYLKTWIAGQPKTSLPSGEAGSANLALLFSAFKRQRLDIQLNYTRLKTETGFQSPITRAHALEVAGNILTALLMISSLLAGLSLLRFGGEPSVAAQMFTAVGAFCAALVAGVRVFNEGLGLRSEVDRYRWYLGSLEAIDARFETASASERFRLLHELEALSYRELRGFLVTQSRSRFIFV